MTCAVPSSDPMSLEDRVGLASNERSRILVAMAPHRTLGDVVRWALTQEPPLIVADVVVQDEYTHDVVLPFGERWLVFDTS